MNDKKRLEIIKMDNERYHQEVVFSSQVLSDIKWLINRVEELEMKLSINTNNMKHLQNKIERYKQALEFYAERDNYQWEVSCRPQQEIDCMVIDDSGYTARKALKGE